MLTVSLRDAFKKELMEIIHQGILLLLHLLHQLRQGAVGDPEAEALPPGRPHAPPLCVRGVRGITAAAASGGSCALGWHGGSQAVG